jgi:hypothetical protein
VIDGYFGAMSAMLEAYPGFSSFLPALRVGLERDGGHEGHSPAISLNSAGRWERRDGAADFPGYRGFWTDGHAVCRIAQCGAGCIPAGARSGSTGLSRYTAIG